MSRLLLVSALALGLATSASAQSSSLSPTAERAALDYLRSEAPAMALSSGDVSDLVVASGHRSALSGINYVYVQQRRDGIPVAGGVATVAVDGRGEVVHAAGSLVPDLHASSARSVATLSASQAVEAAAALVGATGTPRAAVETEPGPTRRTSFGQVAGYDVTAQLTYVPTGRSVALAWEAQVPTKDANHLWVVRIDASTGAELSRHDLVVSESWGKPGSHAHPSEAAAAPTSMAPFVAAVPSPDLAASATPADGSSYLVYPIPYESPIHSPTVPPTDGRVTIDEPANGTASPFGWHDTNGAAGAEYTITWGNNVRAYQDRLDDNVGIAADSPDCGAGLDCAFPLDLTLAPSSYTPAATANLFYWNNIIHDVLYFYGFDEASGNFQENNYGNGGLGGDYVRAEAQDGADVGKSNNANFGTPSDGSPPRMQMFEWTTATPRLDGDLDAGIIIHEYGHGVSNRLTGGPANVSCLNNSEQMGEGWSDYLGLMLTQQVGDTGPMRRGIGTYALNEPTTGDGIRPAPYSTDFGENSFTYGDIGGLAIPHGVGFVWATALWEMTWELIDAYGYDADVYDATGGAGNQIALALVMEGMKLQPCSPGFVDGRDAILAADEALYPDVPGRGLHYDEIWAAFARRGLGYSADQGSSGSTTDGTEAFDTPIVAGAVEISPTSLAFNLTPGGTSSSDVTISNTGSPGDGDVQYTAQITRQDQPEESSFGAGGPDAFGYAWIDSDEPGGPAVSFEDISGTGSAVTFSPTGTFAAGDEGYADVALPFTFPFYGVDKSSIRVMSNGFATFSSAVGNMYTNPSSFPGSSSPTNYNDVIAPFWDDLDQSAGGTVYTGTLGDGRFVIQWDEVPRFNSAGSAMTFQIILSADGTIEFQYETMTGTLTSASTGLENADASIGLEVAVNEAYVASNKAVLFYSPVIWASVAPTSGTVDEGASDDVTVSVDATELPSGIYTADLTIETNDPDALVTVVPITLTVADDGTISIVVDGARGMRYLGAPANGVTVDDLADQNLVRGVPGYYPAANPPNLWTSYDAVSADWVVSTGTGEVLQPGQAFRWRMYDRNVGNPDISRSVELPFTLSTSLPANTADVTVTLQTGGSRFNYLANPFGEPLDVTGVFGWPGGNNVAPGFGVEVFDEIAAAWVPASGSIQPWEAFRIRAKGPLVSGDPRTLTIPYPAAPPVASAREAAEALAAVDREHGIARLPFTVAGRSADGARLAAAFDVAFTDGARAALDDDDAPATAPLAEAALTAGPRVGGALLAVDARPFAPGEVPIALDARGAERAVTLRWDAAALPAGLPVVLVDLATGVEVDVRTRSSYTFDVAPRAAWTEAEIDGAGELADPSAATDRFVLRIGAVLADAEAVDTVELTTIAPNPSSTTARVAFAVPTSGRARVSVVDVRGREVAVLVDGAVEAGRHEAVLEAGRLAAGVYLVRLEAGGQVVTRQAAIVR